MTDCPVFYLIALFEYDSRRHFSAIHAKLAANSN
jgi:hypothetical protein